MKNTDTFYKFVLFIYGCLIGTLFVLWLCSSPAHGTNYHYEESHKGSRAHPIIESMGANNFIFNERQMAKFNRNHHLYIEVMVEYNSPESTGIATITIKSNTGEIILENFKCYYVHLAFGRTTVEIMKPNIKIMKMLGSSIMDIGK